MMLLDKMTRLLESTRHSLRHSVPLSLSFIRLDQSDGPWKDLTARVDLNIYVTTRVIFPDLTKLLKSDRVATVFMGSASLHESSNRLWCVKSVESPSFEIAFVPWIRIKAMTENRFKFSNTRITAVSAVFTSYPVTAIPGVAADKCALRLSCWRCSSSLH